MTLSDIITIVAIHVVVPSVGAAACEFHVTAGQTYAIEILPGPEFDRVSRMKPVIEVGVNSAGPSVGLALAREINRPVAVIFATLGVMLLGGAIRTAKN